MKVPTTEAAAPLRTESAKHISADVACGDNPRVVQITTIALSILFAIVVMSKGVPSLRQDWAWPTSSQEAIRFLVDSWGGWSPIGLGHAVPYPSGYLLAVVICPLLAAVGPTLGLFIFLCCIAGMIAFGTRALIRSAAPDSLMTVGLVAFALFNPWTYSKVVAGHIVMLVAYAGVIWLLSAALGPAPRLRAVLGALILCYAQLQFFLIAVVMVAFLVPRRLAIKAIGIMLIIAMPTIFGVVANWSTLSSIPYTLAWEQSQSVHPIDALFLVGYFARYTAPISLMAHIAAALVLVIAAVGCVKAWPDASRSRSVKIFVLMAIVSLVAASGTIGIFGPLYAYLVQHLRFTGVYRELYDLLAYLAIAYIALASNVRSRWAGVLAMVSGSAALSCWLIYPISNWTVSQASLPRINISAPEHSRFALYPAFQPMSFHGAGSGADPDAYSRDHDIEPINEYSLRYPESVALLRYERSGDSSVLSHLSVSTLVLRTGYQTEVSALKAQIGNFPGLAAPSFGEIRHISYTPELTVLALPQIGLLSDKIGNGNVFFGDARAIRSGLPAYSLVLAPNRSADPQDDWVDANFTFLNRPRAAQGLGGAATASSRASLRLPRAAYLLALVEGRLYERGDLISGANNGYAWLRVPQGPGVMTLHCKGFCVIVATAQALPVAPLNPPARPYREVKFSRPLPWLVQAKIPAHSAPTLRYNVRFDNWWKAFDGRQQFAHVRLDETVNGWIIGSSPKARQILIVNEFAAIQAMFEVIGTLIVIVLVLYEIKQLLIKAYRTSLWSGGE